MSWPLAAACIVTFLHHVGAQMRGPVLPLYAVAHGATPTGVGVIVAAHMAVAAVGSVPLGRASDLAGRRRLLLAGMAVSGITSGLLPLVEGTAALAVIYGLAGLGVAAFTPSALSLVADLAAPGAMGRAYAWYATAHYGAIGVGAFIGGVVAGVWGYRPAFVAGAGVVAVASGFGWLTVRDPVDERAATARRGATLRDVRSNRAVWAGWTVAGAGMATQGVVFTFFPLLADDRGLAPAAIGLVFLVLGVANTGARVPAGRLVDRTKHPMSCAIAGVAVASLATAALPFAHGHAALFVLAAVFGAASGAAGVAIGVALAHAASPATRGLVMGGYSTCLYLGLAVGSLAAGPVIARHGHVGGFLGGAVTGVIGALVAGGLWAGPRPRRPSPTPGTR